MVRGSRRKGIVTVILLSLSLPLTGCLHTGSEPPLLPGSSGYSPGARGAYSVTSNPPSNPSGVMPAGAFTSTGDVRKASFSQPMANGQGDLVPDHTLGTPTVMGAPINLPLPTEKQMVSHPPHRVAPPDILMIESLRLIPKGPYKLEPMEVLLIEVNGAFMKKDATGIDRPGIAGQFMISPDGKINLGQTLLPIEVRGMTVDEAQARIYNYIKSVVKQNVTFDVSVTLVQMRGMQNVRGEHLVRPDGTISLGMYGAVYVAGMTLGQVKCVVENHLAAYLISPQVSVDVLAYNSRKIYIIADGAGYGQQVVALPATGGETVLDAISRVQGLPPVASLKKIWVARPAPAGHPCSQILPVNWQAIVQGGDTTTNYQLLPGDRIYIDSDCLIKTYMVLDKFLAPIERVLGVTLLGSSTFQNLRGNTTGQLLIAR